MKNLKHKAFCKAYLYDEKTRFNATKTYMRIYPSASYHTALVNGPRLLGKTREVITEMLFEGFVPEEISSLCRSLKSLTEARKPVFYRGKRIGYKSDGRLQLAALTLILKLSGIIQS